MKSIKIVSMTFALLTLVSLGSSPLTADPVSILDVATGETYTLFDVDATGRILMSQKSPVTPIRTLSTPPSIAALLADTKPLSTGDYVAKRPSFSAIITPGSGGSITSYNFHILNAGTQAVIASGSVTTPETPPTSAITAEFQPSNNLPSDTSLFLRVIASGDTGLISSSDSALFSVSGAFKLSTVFNSPNPFNPNLEPTYIEYQSHDGRTPSIDPRDGPIKALLLLG